MATLTISGLDPALKHEAAEILKSHGMMRIPDESVHHSGLKASTFPVGIRPAFRFDSGHHSGAIRPV